jgi:acetyl esterase
LVLNFHGGGWISGNLQNNDFYCAVLAKEVHCMVVSVDYRLAPEYKFPTPVNDALDAHAWVLSNAEDLGIDANRVCVTGDSAGGNLATVLCRKNCEQGGPPIHFQALIYPATDSRMEYESIDKHAHAPILTKQDIHHCIELYLDDPANMLHPDFSPMVADSLEMMPPAVVVTAGNDPLADDGRLYAERLQSSGVQAEWLHYPEDIHGFFTFPNHSKSGREAIYEVASKIKARFELLSA